MADTNDVTNFGTQVLPYGVFRPSSLSPRVGVAVGELVLDLSALFEAPDEFAQPSLNGFLARGRDRWNEVRELVQARVSRGVSPRQTGVHRISDVEVLLPIEVADYVDFFSGIEHATNAGRILRPDEEPLKANYRHLPVGYHGRAGTVITSGVDVVRPQGQVQSDDGITVQPSARMDFEIELGYIVGIPSQLGSPVPAEAFREHVFGVVILVDWSARDIQAWEYQPLGPFLAKSFATTISPWVVPLGALDWVDGPAQDPEVADYLKVAEPRNPSIQLELDLNGVLLSKVWAEGLYWSPAQQLAHLTCNGAALRTGDLYGTGTISSFDPAAMGSMLEMSWGGTRPIELGSGRRRTFLEDRDEVVVRATVGGDSAKPLGQSRTVVVPAVT